MNHGQNRPLIEHVLDDFTLPWQDPPADVVLLHPGLSGNLRLYRAWVPILGDTFRVLRVTARGQGGTPKPDDYTWSLDNFVGDVLDVLDHLGIERVHWAGASGGGIYGQYAAITAPERITTLSLIATTPRFRGPAGQEYDTWLAPLDSGDREEFLWRDAERRFGLDTPARTEWIIKEMSRTSGAISAELHRWVHTVNLIDRLPEISCPTLVVTGEHDTLTSIEDADIFTERIPNVRQEIVKGLPHNIAYTHPHEIASIVKRFILSTMS